MGIIKVDGTYIQDPQTLEWGLQDLDSENGSGRNQQGLMFRDRVSMKRKLTLTFPPLEPTAMSTLLKAVDKEFFNCEYPDAHDGNTRTSVMYVGDRTAPLYMYNPDEGKWLWQGLSMNFVER